jgi:glycosyltransferase involved in cell wall biosynthesis
LTRLIRDVRRFNPTVVHGLLYHGYVLGAVAGVLCGVPLIVSSRRGLSDARRRRGLSRLAVAAVNAWTDGVIANSEAVREDTIRSERLSPGLVTVIPNGIDVGRYSVSDRERTRAELGLGPEPVAIVLANFIGYKGHGYFLQAWRAVCARYPTAIALLIGDGPRRAAVEAEAKALGLGARIRFLGLRQDVPGLLPAGDLLVHPSLEEGSSNAILEAMAAGLPVVATTVGGTPEAVRHGETGYLVPPRDSDAIADAVFRVLGQPDAGREMGHAGRRRVLAEFQLSTMIQRYEGLYGQLLRDKRMS